MASPFIISKKTFLIVSMYYESDALILFILLAPVHIPESILFPVYRSLFRVWEDIALNNPVYLIAPSIDEQYTTIRLYNQIAPE